MTTAWRILTAALLSLVVLLPIRPAVASGGQSASAGPWILRSSSVLPNAHADQGMATLLLPKGRTTVVTRGGGSVPHELRERGWTHVGDPDSAAGYLLDAYQGSASTGAKLFVLTNPNGRQTLYRHALVPGESFHNSFAAIAPGGQWFVSGEWGTMRRLLVFPMPVLNPRASTNLTLAATITLNRPVRNVQGCAFDSTTTLVCSTNDPSTDLYPVAKQVLRVHLARPLDGRPVRASVTLLGAVPQDPTCPGSGETEGVDVHGNRLLLAVVTPCHATRVYTYLRSP